MLLLTAYLFMPRPEHQQVRKQNKNKKIGPLIAVPTNNLISKQTS